MIWFKKIVILAIGFLDILSCEAKVRNDSPLVWDMYSLDLMKNGGIKGGEMKKVLREANYFCGITPVAVTDKKALTFEPDKHYFCCIGPYWWPDSLNKGEYINRDGIVNPESKNYDNSRLLELVTRCKTLSEAFYITGNSLYYDTFVKQLRVWFLDKDTYMYPTFEYAQIVPGQNNNKGRSTGLISAYYFNTLIESIRLVNGMKKVDRRTMRGVQKWFLDFAEDSESRYGEKFYKMNNNISLAFDVMMANMYLFASKEKKAKEIVDIFSTLRIEKQINPDGTQPVELKRTKAFSYSIYNLSHIVDMCFLARYWYPNYYQVHQERIIMAFDYLEPFIEDPSTFPFKQITSWAKCKKEYLYQKDRLKRLELQ